MSEFEPAQQVEPSGDSMIFVQAFIQSVKMMPQLEQDLLAGRQNQALE
jgi:hypothetical protein